MTTASPTPDCPTAAVTPLQREVDGLLLAIDSLKRVSADMIGPKGLKLRTFGEGTMLDLARKIHGEIGDLLRDVADAASETAP